MIGALAVFLDEAEGFFRVDRSVDKIFEKQLAGGVMGAAEGGKNAAIFEDFQGPQVDFLIASHGVHKSRLVAGEAGRIEDDEVVFRFRVFEKIEDVVLKDLNVEVV